ncbi:DUF2306 domain-containing protein [Paludisphaera soli]|uniref:DUF2306 domain-containing protein n=1 Tax=Paludisphaera soli TaxID=2712865 RepID=UPI0013EBF556|nr:DUF2306 domain-containing protein [Paludisphaera soli]
MNSIRRPVRPVSLRRVQAWLAGVVVLRVVASVAANYRAYIPPDFGSEFLRGREAYFWGGYSWAFYVHIASGPVALVLGLFLVGEWSRKRLRAWHRRLGWVQVMCVLGLVTPSGLAMARYAAAGPVAAVGLASLAVATAACTTLGARAAARRRFAEHRRWMWRSYLLLASAVVLRLLGGLATVLGIAAPWFDPLANWMSWLLPLAAFEVCERIRRRSGTIAAGARAVTTR